MRAVFLGTPASAVPALHALSRVATVDLVLTQPDRPRGRSATPQPPPVKVAAAKLGIDVEQPESSGEIAGLIADGVDVAVVVAFGKLIKPAALARPRAGFVNLHFSLLPRWRGAAPVQRAIMAGDMVSGVSLMRLDEGLDTGPVVATWATKIAPMETSGELLTRLSQGGAGLLESCLQRYVAGGLVAVPQPDTGATMAPKVDKQELAVRWTDPAVAIERQIRGLGPRPGAYAELGGERLRLLRARAVAGRGEPGLLSFDGRVLMCGTGDGLVELIEVQPSGKAAMSGPDWARGRRGQIGRLT